MPESGKILGFVLITLASLIMAACSTMNRTLKNVSPFVVLFWHGFGGLTIATFVALVEYLFLTDSAHGGIRVFHYDREQYGYLIGASLFDSMAVFG